MYPSYFKNEDNLPCVSKRMNQGTTVPAVSQLGIRYVQVWTWCVDVRLANVCE